MKADYKANFFNRTLLNFKNSRRDFIKTSGKAAITGIASFALPFSSNASFETEKLSDLKNISSPDNDLFWSGVRSQFVLNPDIIQMNTSTEGAMPRSVISGLYNYSMKFAEDPIEACISNENFEIKQKKNCLKSAQFLGADPGDIVLTSNTTEGLHIAINGLALNRGDEIITTLHEHGSLYSPLHILKDRGGISVRELALPSPANNKQLIVDIFERAITNKTRVLCFCHINYTTGLRMPVKELCEIARARGIITIVDGAHSIGMIDLDLQELGCDFFACSGHKWLNGPPGTGILYIRNAKENPHGLWPVLTEVYAVKKSFPVSKLLQMRGQMNTPALCAMIDAMEMQNVIGKSRIQDRIHSLNNYLKEKVVELWGSRSLLSPIGNNELSSGIASFIPFKDYSDRYARQKFSHISRTLKKEHKTNIRNIWFRDHESDRQDTFVLRASTHIFNSYAEIDKVLDTIRDIVNKM